MRQRLRNEDKRFVIAIDGGSGSGKSTIGAAVAAELGATLVPRDDFFSAHVTHEGWAAKDTAQRAADCIDWQRLRREVLEPLVAGQIARWATFDFTQGVCTDGSYGSSLNWKKALPPASIIVVEGTYSARPELADLIDLSVLVDVPAPVRHQMLEMRSEADWLAMWHVRWDRAEDYHFSEIRPIASFDLVVTNPVSEQSGGSVNNLNKPDNADLIARATAVLKPVRVKDRLFGDVGAAVLSEAGEVFTGVSVDTAGWGLCAERSALAAMITAGQYRIVRVVAVWKDEITGKLHILPPCGICREFMRSINEANLSAMVITSRNRSVPLRELLPLHEWPPAELQEGE